MQMEQFHAHDDIAKLISEQYVGMKNSNSTHGKNGKNLGQNSCQGQPLHCQEQQLTKK